MALSTTDQKLQQIVSADPPATIDQVISVMQAIDDLLPGGDGLKRFNLLYLFVTREVRDHLGNAAFEDPQWLPDWMWYLPTSIASGVLLEVKSDDQAIP